jgi:hypothetical protein
VFNMFEEGVLAQIVSGDVSSGTLVEAKL